MEVAGDEWAATNELQAVVREEDAAGRKKKKKKYTTMRQLSIRVTSPNKQTNTDRRAEEVACSERMGYQVTASHERWRSNSEARPVSKAPKPSFGILAFRV